MTLKLGGSIVYDHVFSADGPAPNPFNSHDLESVQQMVPMRKTHAAVRGVPTFNPMNTVAGDPMEMMTNVCICLLA